MLGGDFRACDAYDLSEQLDQVKAPTLILVGEEDKMTPMRFAEGLREGIRDAELQVIPGAGHMAPLEQPGKTADLIREFLEKVPRH